MTIKVVVEPKAIDFKHEFTGKVNFYLSIRITEGKVTIEGIDLQDNVLRNWSGYSHGTFAIDDSFTVPKDSVFVLSDNLSAQHDDSRVFGPISKSIISGWVW